jgi:purine nucleosidase
LQNVLKKAIITNNPVTLLVTEPITPLSNILRDNPTLNKGIKRVIWMGGAIRVPGNLDPETIPTEIANDKAEWNAFWDPYAVDWIFKNTSFPIIMLPLDVTDQAKLTDSFMTSLEKQSAQYRYSTLVYSLYSLVKDQPYFEMWNTLTSVYLARPDLFDTPVQMCLSITTEGYLQGAISEDTNGRLVDVVLNLRDSDGFYGYVLAQLQRN